MNNYLVPANSKKSMMYFGMFTLSDLILFGVGVSVSLLLFMILPIERLLFAVIALTPGIICGGLVIPIPNYHNVRTVIKLAWEFYTTRQKYVWKGWCYKDGKTDKE